jgi:hypothetical protein
VKSTEKKNIGCQGELEIVLEPDLLVHTYNPHTEKAKAGGS